MGFLFKRYEPLALAAFALVLAFATVTRLLRHRRVRADETGEAPSDNAPMSRQGR